MKSIKPQKSYCCPTKQYYSNDINNLVQTLKILPRVIIYKKSLKVKNIYESIINITNKGMYKRHLIYSTDSSDTTIHVYPPELMDNFLQPDQALQITVRIETLRKSQINRRRHIFISSQHPNIIFSIPIIILTKDGDISIPSDLILPPTTVENFTYYEMILFNKSSKKLQFNIKCAQQNLTVHTKSFNILRRDYAKILIQIYCSELKVIKDVLKLKINTGDNIDIPFKHEPLTWSLFIDTININFDSLRFKREEITEFSICNESQKDCVFHVDFISVKDNDNLDDNWRISQSTTSQLKLNDMMKQNLDKFSFRHFEFKPKCATIPPNFSYTVHITFHPVMHKDFVITDNDIPPFCIMSAIMITWQDNEKTQKRNILLKGEIIGPEIELKPTVLDLRQIYFGEEYCVQVKVINIDDMCDAHVVLYDVINRDTAHILAKPMEGLILKPLQTGIFQIQFYSIAIGKFMVKLEFKVKNGGIYSMVIKGYSQHVRVKCFPDIIDLGVIPIAMPQKRLVLLMNPLSVPLTVQCTVREDGSETPLILNARNVDEQLPITINDPLYYLKQSCEKTASETYFAEDLKEEFEFRFNCKNSETSLLSVRSQIEDNSSSCSSEFERLALDLIPDMSYDLVSCLKTNKIFDKTELEKKIIEEAFNVLLKTPYFCDMDKYKNYTQMDWNSLATDPKEIYCNNEIIRLKPNTGKAISIMIIPNVIGFHNKYIELRVCPLTTQQQQQQTTGGCKNVDCGQIVETEHMISKLWIEYNCAVPEVIWDNVVIMQDQLYAGEYYDFQMTFENNSNIGGFFYYDVIPQSNLGVMIFPNKKWKYFIEPCSKLYVPCKVKFTKIGFINLAGLIKFVGVYACYPFHIKSEVLPPKVNFYPRTILKTLNVLEFMKYNIFIENATPTTTWFKIKLKDETNMSIEPCGAQLGPTGQAMYITLNTMYKDPGTYKNILYIIMEFETIEKIPITINVKGIPLFFVPEIRNQDLNIGNILCNTEEYYYADKANYTKVIKVINKGLRHYRLSITRTKSSSKPTCRINSLKSKLTIIPNNLIISPQSETTFNITINCCEATEIFSEFRLQLTDHNDVKHMESNRFTLSATLIMPQVVWNRRDIVMNYYRTHKYKEQEQWETIKLLNIADTIIDYVHLKVTGPFKIKELFEHNYNKELHFSMCGLERKEFFIMLNKDEIRNHLNTYYEGCITCQANYRVQKSVRLKLFVFIPSLCLKQNQITLFTKYDEGGTYIELTNRGEVPAIYKWKKLKEEWHYICQEDNTQQVASLILSDLMHMLELETPQPEKDSETNMTLRYQKFKCLLKEIEDPLNIKEIVLEIIENLDLNAKRYKLCYQTPTPLAADGINIENKFKLNFPNGNILDKFNKYSQDHIQAKIDDILNMEITQLQDEFNENINEIEKHFESQTIFVNRKFVPISSATTLETEMSSNEETCVYHTLDDILGHLKLDDSYIISEPSTETCELRNSVYFFDKCGLLPEQQKEMCALHIPAIRKGFEVRAIFQLDVVGGKSQQLEIILVNLDKTITLSKDNIYLGLKPWYERYRCKTLAQNTTNYEISLKIKQIPKIQEKLSKIATGFLHILENKTPHLMPYQSTHIHCEGIMGFNEEFQREIAININESEELRLKLKGQGLMPMLIISKPLLPLKQQEPYEIIEEYRLMQKIYYFEIFKSIIEKDEHIPYDKDEEENALKETKSFLTDLTLLTTDSEYDSEMELKKDLQFFKLMQTYVLINNNEDLPNCTVLEQQMQTEKFLQQLSFSTETCSLLNQLYQNYLLQLKSYDEIKPLNLKHFLVESLPFQLGIHILDMGKVYFNQYSKYSFKMEFIGPGRLVTAARSEIKIPGLMIDFEILKNKDNDNFTYYRSEEKSTICDKQAYRNINERLRDLENNSKLKHAHSYDINSLQQHQRNINFKKTKCLRNNYNSLNKFVYKEQKYHFTHCKLFANSKDNFSETFIKVNVLFRPLKSHYEHKQLVEDYLYIDLHMGPTVPIMLRAVIIDRNRNDK